MSIDLEVGKIKALDITEKNSEAKVHFIPAKIKTESTKDAKHVFEKYNYMNYDKTPSKNGALKTALNWIKVENVLHEPVNPEDLKMVPDTEKNSLEKDACMTNKIRGFPLTGVPAMVPNHKVDAYRESRKIISKKYARPFDVNHIFIKYTYWNYDKIKKIKKEETTDS